LILAETNYQVAEDNAFPEVTVTGIQNGEIYSNPVIPEITVSDCRLANVVTTLDDTSYEQGTVIDTDGDHILTVLAEDIGGRMTEVSIAFTVQIFVNSAPVAEIAPLADLIAGEEIFLNGTGSYDPDGDEILTYSWSIDRPDLSTVVMYGPSPVFTADLPGEYKISLVVNDGELDSEPAGTTVTAQTQTITTCNVVVQPESPCTVKTDYLAAQICSKSYSIHTYQDYLDYEADNYGFDGKKYRNIKIMDDISLPEGDLIIHSPCEIRVTANIALSAENGIVCLDGGRGIENDKGIFITAQQVAIVSERGDAGLGSKSRVRANELYISAEGSAQIGKKSVIDVAGPVSLVSTGSTGESKPRIREGTLLTAGSLFMKGVGRVAIEKDVRAELTGPVWMQSGDDFSQAETETDTWPSLFSKSKCEIEPKLVIIDKDTVLTASALCMEARKQVVIGTDTTISLAGDLSMISTAGHSASKVLIKPEARVSAAKVFMQADKQVELNKNTWLNATGPVTMHSIGDHHSSKAWIHPGATVTADSLDLSGRKAALGSHSSVEVSGDFHMEAEDLRKCEIKGTYTAGSTSGICLE
jgi:hypothetical protein